MKTLRLHALLPLLALLGCSKSDAPASASAAPGAEKKLTIGVAFETLQTEYWVAGFEAI
jgi:ABC-type sugar transport system substrate-binding protein